MAASSPPFMLPFDGISPRFADPPTCGPRVSVLGKVTMGARALLGAGVVIRADGEVVRIGDDIVLGPDCTVHIVHQAIPCLIGDRVTVGRNAVIHACTVGNDVVIGDDVVVLDGAVVEDGVVIENASTVFPRKVLAAGRRFAGSPVEDLEVASPGDRTARGRVLRQAAEASLSEEALAPAETLPGVFLARTARLSGRIDLGPQSSVFFGCAIDAGPAHVLVGGATNIQDNTKVTCRSTGVVIGADTTIGHNVLIEDCIVGARTLIGMGATLKADTRVDDDVLLAAGAVTEPGQHLEGGWLWGGRPARPMQRLNEARRTMMANTIEHYCGYGEAFRQAQERLAAGDRI